MRKVAVRMILKASPLLGISVLCPVRVLSADYHAICKDARDYAGCIKHQSSQSRASAHGNIKYEMSSLSENIPFLTKFHEGMLKRIKTGKAKRCITMDLVCYEMSSESDQFDKPVPYGWLGYHVNEPYSIYMYPVPEAGFDLSNMDKPIGRYLVFTGFSRGLTDEIAATPTINLGSPGSSTRCRRSGSSYIRQNGSGNVTTYRNSAGGIDATASGFDFDVNSLGVTNCKTESGPPVIIYGKPGQKGGELYQRKFRTIVDCRDQSEISAFSLRDGRPNQKKKYVSTVNGKLMGHTIHARYFDMVCSLYLPGKVDFPLSAINPLNGQRHTESVVEIIKESTYKFFP